MIVALCVDERGGMTFHRRRQSQDRVLRARLLEQCAGALWMNAYSARQFADCPPERLRVDEQFLLHAGAGETCFVEDQPLRPHEPRIERILLYRWGRRYPSDQKFDLTLSGWKLLRTSEFSGYSHETITEEIYER